jgi:hypothetical protein
MVNQRAKILVKETELVVTQRVKAMTESIPVVDNAKPVFKDSKGQKFKKFFRLEFLVADYWSLC